MAVTPSLFLIGGKEVYHPRKDRREPPTVVLVVPSSQYHKFPETATYPPAELFGGVGLIGAAAPAAHPAIPGRN